MSVKLYKTEKENYILIDPTKGTYDDGYVLGTSRESQYNKLSLKNCQDIERSYDLDELVNETFDNMGYHSTVTLHEEKQFKLGYRLAFQKALELMGDKKFTEDDMSKAWSEGYHRRVDEINGNELRYFDKFIQSLQQTEWDVEIVKDEEKEFIFDPAMGISQGHYLDKPKLDADGCLILKRV